MIYITKRKLFSILRGIDASAIKDPIRLHFKQKYFFLSSKNIENITTYYLFFQDPQMFNESNFVRWKDSKSFVYESNPAFHKDQYCSYLLSKFENIWIPPKFKARELTKELRNWASEKKTLFQSHRKQFIEACITYFNNKYPSLELNLEDFHQIQLDNSGVEQFENFTLEELKVSLKETLEKAKVYFEDEKKRRVLSHFKEKYFLRLKEDRIYKNGTGLDDKVVKDILNEIDEKYVKPINEIIIQICIKEFLDKKEFNTTILEALNFKNCSSCYPDYKKGDKANVGFIDKH